MSELQDDSQRAVAYLKGEMSDDERQAFEADLTSPERREHLERAREVLDTLAAASEKSIIRLVHGMIQDAIRAEASDIHVVPTRHREGSEGGGMVVYLRIDGVLHKIAAHPGALHRPVVDRWKVMAECNLQERRLPQEGRIGVTHRGEEYDLRVTILPTLLGERVTARILSKSALPPDLPSLGLPAAQIERLRRLIHRPSGFVAVAAPPGSGKTTLLYLLLREITAQPTAPATVITVEDPIEHSLDGDLVSQISVHRRAGLTYPTAVRAMLRCDPDVLLVGDLPDLETGQLALHAAMTGHRVLTALGANNAIGGIQRLREIGLDPASIALATTGIISQRLVRKPCPACATAYEPDGVVLHHLGLSSADAAYQRGTGCDACRQTGFSGRVALIEVLELDAMVRRRIVERASPESLWQETLGRGGSLWEDAREKVRQGLTTVEEVTRALFDYPFPAGAPATLA